MGRAVLQDFYVPRRQMSVAEFRKNSAAGFPGGKAWRREVVR